MSLNKPLQLNSEFVKEISSIMLQLTGVQFFDKQSGMIQSRLFKRMLELGIREPAAYLKYLKENYDSESKILVSLLTTHHTFFFREFFHFDFLLKEGLDKLIKEVRSQKQNKIRIWSAACSQGQEVYSLAMFLDYHLAKMAPDIGYEILGTDIDIDCIKVAKNGVYRFEQIKEIPTLYQGDNWQKGTGDIAHFVRLKDHIRTHCQFVTSNLFDMSLLMGQSFHLIFCRNVFIYFNQTQINMVSKNLFNLLNPNGYLFLGLSESLHGNSLPAQQVGASIYRKPSELPVAEKIDSEVEEVTSPQAELKIVEKQKTRVLCVDDSPVILTLLKKILSPEHDFEVVATATNGAEAREAVLKYKPDIVTLDIHMPHISGVDYLRQFYSDSHPPVVMISSVSREEADFGVQSLELGAVDFIEKPSLATLQDKADEIRIKLRCAVDFSINKKEAHVELVKKFKMDFSAVNSSGLVRICVAGLGELQKIKAMIQEFGASYPPFVILLHGAESFIPLLVEKMQTGPLKVHRLEDHVVLSSNHVYLASFDQFDSVQKMLSIQTPCHLFVLGDTPSTVVNRICKMKQAHVILEENIILQNKSTYLMIQRTAGEVVPYSSMIYHSSRWVLSQNKKAVAS